MSASIGRTPHDLVIASVTRSLALIMIVAASTITIVAQSPTVVTKSLTLDPSRPTAPLVIRGKNIVIDGRGAVIEGAKAASTKEFKGTGIVIDGAENVVIRDVRIRGFEIGLHAKGSKNVVLERCDISDNFHDPDFGWGENGTRGGIVLEDTEGSVLEDCKAERNWDGLTLLRSTRTVVRKCDFSHASNTCLRLWTATQNVFEDNDLSYGLRISPGEVHARDSAGVLIESGSNRNAFRRNDCTHGGDGIFIRVLNGWCSTDNVFEENDTSYAHNNCVESWSPRNVWIRNKANHGSYGFWLGASDQTVLIGNEAAFNGRPDGHHNSPHLPDAGHAGIVFMFGPSSHTVLRENHCHDNFGAGIAAIGDLDSEGKSWRAHHWVIDDNRIERNRWGIYLCFADWIDIGPQHFEGNEKGDVFEGGAVSRVTRRQGVVGSAPPPVAVLTAPVRAIVGRPVTFDASRSRAAPDETLSFAFDFGDGTTSDQATIDHVFDTPGFKRVGLTITDGTRSDLAWRDLYVVRDEVEAAVTESEVGAWTCIDPSSKATFTMDRARVIVGLASLHARVAPYGGGRVFLSASLPEVAEDGAPSAPRRLSFWLHCRNEGTPAWQDKNPLIVIEGKDAMEKLTLTPTKDLLSKPPFNEAREGWWHVDISLEGDGSFGAEGRMPKQPRRILLGFDSWGAPPLEFWVDGLRLD